MSQENLGSRGSDVHPVSPWTTHSRVVFMGITSRNCGQVSLENTEIMLRIKLNSNFRTFQSL